MLPHTSPLITGSPGGIGRATAKALAAFGCDITLNGFATPEVIEDRLQMIRGLGVSARYMARDLRQPGQIAELVESTRREHGGLEISVNKAVARSFGAVENFAPEQWDEALAVNLSAPFHRSPCAARDLRSSRRNLNLDPASARKFVRDENDAGLIAFLCGSRGDRSTTFRLDLARRGWLGRGQPGRERRRTLGTMLVGKGTVSFNPRSATHSARASRSLSPAARCRQLPR